MNLIQLVINLIYHLSPFYYMDTNLNYFKLIFNVIQGSHCNLKRPIYDSATTS